MSLGALLVVQRVLALAAAVLIIVGLKRLSSPATARAGNGLAAWGLALAVAATFVTGVPHHLGLILFGLALGSGLGFWGGRAVKMTDMPQMVALLNGLGGGAAAAVAAAEFIALGGIPGPLFHVASILAGTLIGGLSFAGSLVAFAKLQGLVGERPARIPGGRALQGAVVAVAILLAWIAGASGSLPAFIAFVLLSLALGVLMVVPIGGADMPVVISILN